MRGSILFLLIAATAAAAVWFAVGDRAPNGRPVAPTVTDGAPLAATADSMAALAASASTPAAPTPTPYLRLTELAADGTALALTQAAEELRHTQALHTEQERAAAQAAADTATASAGALLVQQASDAATLAALIPTLTRTPTLTPTPDAIATQRAELAATSWHYASVLGPPLVVVVVIVCLIGVAIAIGGAKANAIEGESKARQIEAQGKADAARAEADARAYAIRAEGDARAWAAGLREVRVGVALVSHTSPEPIMAGVASFPLGQPATDPGQVGPPDRVGPVVIQHSPDTRRAIAILREAIRLQRQEGGELSRCLPAADRFADHDERAAVVRALVERGELIQGGGRGNRTQVRRDNLGDLLRAVERGQVAVSLPPRRPTAKPAVENPGKAGKPAATAGFSGEWGGSAEGE